MGVKWSTTSQPILGETKMKFQIQGFARFKFNVTAEQLDVLEKLANEHYDARCRATAQPGNRNDPTSGLLNGWRLSLEHGWQIDATETELDILQKVLEGPIYKNEKLSKIRDDLQRDFTRARRQYHAVFDQWRAEFDTDQV